MRYRCTIRCLFCLLTCMVALPRCAHPQSARQKQYLEEILQINMAQDHRHAISRRPTLQDSTWLDWLHRTGELPPDFEQLPSIPFLPEPLVLAKDASQPVRTRQAWREKRDWIRAQYQHWVSGTAPPPPGNVAARVLSDRREAGTRIQLIELTFGPGHQGRMTLELMIPDGQGAMPVYMTQWNHRSWAQLAVRRGYIGCVYAAADSKDDTQAYQALYPAYDFTALMRRAWGASRVVDYLLTRPEVNHEQIAITGHSRNGKQALWAAAFDERISAVISSSCGTGGITPWRYSDPQYGNQTLDDICSNAAHWFHPRLRFFFGREDRLPADQNLLLSLIAPRPLLFHYSVAERQLNPWVNEQCYQSVKKVYQFLDAGDNIAVLPRLGEHAVATRDLERCIDFLDIRFGRKALPWTNDLYYNYSFKAWAAAHTQDSVIAGTIVPVSLQGAVVSNKTYPALRQKILARLEWLTGEEPPGVKPGSILPPDPSRIDWIDLIIGRPVVKGAEVMRIAPYAAMGDHLAGSLYYPVDEAGNRRVSPQGKMPVVIYLHEYAYAHGFAAGYSERGGRGNAALFQALTDQGFAVLAIDMFGFGTRLAEAKHFYERFPQWSLMGKMLADVKACIDAVASFSYIDSSRIFLLGNTIGGTVALLSAAQDERVAGVAVVAPFSPWRRSNSRYESLRTLSHLHGFMPRLGWYAGKPEAVPVDLAEIISCIAPRPLLFIAPVLDRYTDAEAVRQSLRSAAGVYALYNKKQNLVLQTPLEINRITAPMHQEITNFYSGIVNDKR